MGKTFILPALAVAGFAQPAAAATVTSLPGGVSANIPAANEQTAGPRLFGPGAVPTIVYTAVNGAPVAGPAPVVTGTTGLLTGSANTLAVYGWTGSYASDSVTWAAGGPPIIGNNIYTTATFTLSFLTPIAGFLAEMNWERRFGAVVSFSAYDIAGNLLEAQTLNDGTGVTASNILPVGGSYGFLRPTADIARIDFSNGALGIRNLSVAAATPMPEPSGWAAMVAGTGALGAVLRRRPRRAAAAA